MSGISVYFFITFWCTLGMIILTFVMQGRRSTETSAMRKRVEILEKEVRELKSRR